MTPVRRRQTYSRARSALAALALAASLPGRAAEAAQAAAPPANPSLSQPSALPLKPTRKIAFDTDEGTWMSLDVSPDGRTLVFDLLGDLYTMDARGGEATAITHGLPFDGQPVFSPDGSMIAFTSDRSGAENLWVMNADASHLRQISASDDVTSFISPAWAADGRSIFVSTYKPDLTAEELWRYPLAGGAPIRVTEAKTSPGQSKDTRVSALGAAPTADGRYVYYARRIGTFDEDMTLPMWRIVRGDLRTGEQQTAIGAAGPLVKGVEASIEEDSEIVNAGSAMRPAVSPDGHLLVYAARLGGRTGLRIRDLRDGADRWLVFPIDRDDQEGVETRDLVPRHVFTPDGSALFASYGGKIHRIDVKTGSDTVIPFNAHVDLDIGPFLRQPLKDEVGPVRARLIQDPRPSPDGHTLAFSALGHVYVMPLERGATPRRLTSSLSPEYQPAWSPDGRSIVFTTWTAKAGGAIFVATADGAGAPRAIAQDGAFYTQPQFTPDGRRIVAERSSNDDRLHTYMEYGPLRQGELVSIASSGGDMKIVATGVMGGMPQFIRGDPDHVYMNFGDGLNTVALDSGEHRPVLSVVGPGFYFIEGPVPVDDIKISPDGRWALVQIVQQLHLLAMPEPGQDKRIDLSAPSVRHRKLTSVGADFFGWADDGRSVTWAVGSTTYRRPLAGIALDAPGTPPATGDRPMPGVAGVEMFPATVEIPRDTPRGALLLRGATAITMKGDETVPDADVLVIDAHIAGIGRRGSLSIPAGTTLLDVAGKFITPGFIDTHDHWAEIRRQILDLESWGFRADLAYGVTAGLDPSPLSIDMLAYQDLLEAGLMTGPRVYSTGPAIFSFNRFTSEEEVRDVLSRYVVDYRTRNLKEYRTGNRQVREWVADACRELGIMPTTEGALDMKLDLTQIMDGYSGNEHSLTAVPLYRDVIELLARTRVSYTLTLQISHGGPPAQNYFIERDGALIEPKLRRFAPPYLFSAKMSRRHWYASDQYVFPKVAENAAKVQRAGGLLGVGSHGEVPGPGQVWELQAYASGMTPREALRAATIGSAETIGRQAEIGSLEVGKDADLVIMNKSPLKDIRNAMDIDKVMKNGRLYDAATLTSLWPDRKVLPAPWFKDDHPPAK